MASKSVPKHWNEKSQAQLAEAFEAHHNHQQDIWREGAAKRELTSRMLLKLAKDDPEIERLMKEAEEKTLALAKRPLSKFQLTKPEVVRRVEPPSEHFAASTLQFQFPWPNSWSNSVPDGATVLNPGSMSFSITTEKLNSEAAAVALGIWFQPLPGSTVMTISVNPSISNSYGNDNAFLTPAHTHAWIGLFVQEFDPHTGALLFTNLQQKNNLWDYTHDSDLADGPHSVSVSATLACAPEHVYAIWLWAGGDVESKATSYANLEVTMDEMFIQLG